VRGWLADHAPRRPFPAGPERLAFDKRWQQPFTSRMAGLSWPSNNGGRVLSLMKAGSSGMRRSHAPGRRVKASSSSPSITPAHLIARGNRRAEGEILPRPYCAARQPWCQGFPNQCGLGPRRAQDARRGRWRPYRCQRFEDLDDRRATSGLSGAADPHRPSGKAPCGLTWLIGDMHWPALRSADPHDGWRHSFLRGLLQ